jgi:hypothetical protein
MGADMEMSCDERVLKELGSDICDDYSMSLVRIATGRRILAGSPLAFGEGGMKERIKRILNFKKPSRVIITFAIILVAMLSVGFAVNRVTNEPPGEMNLAYDTEPVQWLNYTYDDSAFGVKFSVTTPESWTVIERKALPGNLEREGSPDSCVAFNDANGNEILGITAMLYSGFGLGTESLKKEYFVTASGLKGVKYYRFYGGHAQVYYMFDVNGHNLEDLYYVTGYGPAYFAYVYTSEEEYLKHKAEIDAVLDSLVIVENPPPPQEQEPDYIVYETALGDTALILLADDFPAFYIAWANAGGLTDRGLLEESAYNDERHLAERTIDFFREQRLIGINRPLIFHVNIMPHKEQADCITVIARTVLDDGIDREMQIDYAMEADYPIREIRQ